MASEFINLKAAGLQTNFQSLMEISPGALLIADNTVINREGIIEPRRGLKVYSENTAFNSKIKQLIEYKGVILSHKGSQLSYDSSGTFSPFSGSYNEPSPDYRIKSLEAKGNLYFTTNEGVKKISVKTKDQLSSAIIIEDAGGPKASSPVLSLNGTSGFLPATSPFQSVSYRILWIYTDANDNLIFGAPSTSMTITNNSGGTRNVRLDFKIPYDVYAGYKYRVYRSEVSTSPTDEMRMVYEGAVTQQEIDAAQLTGDGIFVIDSVSEASRIAGVPLYTNEYSGEGILKANEPPPAAKDIALFKGHMFYANTRTRHLVNLELITNPTSNQTITIQSSGGILNTYTFQNILNSDYPNKIISIKATVKETTLELSRVINGSASEIVSAYYASNIGDTVGKITLQRQDLKNISVTVSGSYYLNIPKLSEVEAFGNRLYFSKYQEHEAVPLLNYIDIGARDQEILRIVSLRESLFIFKGDGIYKLAGDPGINPIWDIGTFDNTSILKAPDSIALMGNNCYYFGNQGIVRLNETALEVISNPIKNKLVPFIATNPNLSTLSFAVGYESDNAVLFWTVSKKTDTQATVCYRYNALTNTWTEWKITKTCGIVNRMDDKLYLGAIDSKNSSAFYIEQERKNFDRFDYADREYSINLVNFINNNYTINTTLSNIISEEDVVIQEQYLTMFQFNTLLKHLDLDTGITHDGYSFYSDSNLRIETGGSLTDKMDKLLDKLTLRVGDTPNIDFKAAISWNNPTGFLELQTKFNLLIDQLNSSNGLNFSNYRKSEGSIKYEAIVIGVNLSKQEVTLNTPTAFIQGPMIVYKGIKTEIEYAPQHAGDPASFKQFSSGTFMFQRRSFYSAQVGYNSDISDNYEEISFIPKTSGIWGEIDWGIGSVWGGQGDQSEIRTLIPLKKQRCRFLGCKFIHGVALESYELYGLSLSVRNYAISDRDYR